MCTEKFRSDTLKWVLEVAVSFKIIKPNAASFDDIKDSFKNNIYSRYMSSKIMLLAFRTQHTA